jgi:hypothetical protein
MKQAGLTIVQLMLVLLIAGIAGSLLVRAIIDMRCEAEPSRSMCQRK